MKYCQYEEYNLSQRVFYFVCFRIKMTQSEQPSLKDVFFLRRNVVGLLAFLGFFNVYTLRVNLSIAIVVMTAPYNVTTENGNVQNVSAGLFQYCLI